MTRPTPVPYFTIALEPLLDIDQTSRSPLTVITAHVDEDTMNGWITLDEPDDIFLLRDRIERYIIQTYPTMAKKKQPETSEYIPGWCIVLEGYLRGWAPAQSYTPGTTLKTSQDIVNDLEDMTELTAATVSSVMTQLGFRTHFCAGGPHGWMMTRMPEAVHVIRPYDPDAHQSED